ncbi:MULTISPECIES: hypothetical protein [Bradyrhizobium]|uniref:hypothetical protein n=1 Tax=Bradyrhizobium TaxID=374 RepID=UPI0018AD44C3|nr:MULTISPECIES: hypothetical protein [Bradyrhizobium]MBR1000948.1 hypothetical protein [Bradyrhizobium liaoningense]MCP1743712.1 hypothetical protein [Bradyrhizobium japonicum]MCP1861426.1 hypothetical protein [Bradyrhizobium japonicum]MCP1892186.1 hypothetical protein [Bradyrhizobium japonicum]MCW2325308.1 hypothetical protein [Bradyrhizobium japonicum]
MRAADAHGSGALETAEKSAGAGDGNAQVFALLHVDRNAHARKVVRTVRQDQIDVLCGPLRYMLVALPEQLIAGAMHEVRPDRKGAVHAFENPSVVLAMRSFSSQFGKDPQPQDITSLHFAVAPDRVNVHIDEM